MEGDRGWMSESPPVKHPLSVAMLALGLTVAVILAGGVLAAAYVSWTSPPADLRWADETPAWSPNGNEVVFASNRVNPDSGIDHLYVMSSDGAHLRRITRDKLDAREPSFSPDGRQIVYAANVLDWSDDYTGKGAIDLISADGTHRRSLTAGVRGDASVPTWAPDGRWIAFVDNVSTDSGLDSRADVYVVRRDGTGLHRLATNIDDWSQPLAWAPDSRQIAVVGANERLYRIGVDAGKPVRVRGSNPRVVTTDVAWSPDGRRIAFVQGRIDPNSCTCDSGVWNRHLWILDLETGHRHLVRRLVSTDSVTDFAVTVTWLGGRTPTLAAFAGSRTLLLTAAGRKTRVLKTRGAMLIQGSASPSGRKLLFVKGPEYAGESAILVGSVAGGRPHPITQRRRPAG